VEEFGAATQATDDNIIRRRKYKTCMRDK